jgi:hypothetical protein
VVEDFAFFVCINPELFEERFERSRIHHISLRGEVPAKDAATVFGEAAQTPVYRRRSIAIIPDRLIAHRHHHCCDSKAIRTARRRR